MQLVFVFVEFIFLKVATEMMFDDGLSVLAAALISISMSIILTGSGIYCFARIEHWSTKPLVAHGGASSPMFEMIGVAVFSVLACVGVGYLIAIGFSERFITMIDRDYRGNDVMWFLAVLAFFPTIAAGGIMYFVIKADR